MLQSEAPQFEQLRTGATFISAIRPRRLTCTYRHSTQSLHPTGLPGGSTEVCGLRKLMLRYKLYELQCAMPFGPTADLQPDINTSECSCFGHFASTVLAADSRNSQAADKL